MPRSIALCTTLRVASRSMRPPKLLQPRPTTDTRRPDLPRFRSCMRCSRLADAPAARRRTLCRAMRACRQVRTLEPLLLDGALDGRHGFGAGGVQAQDRVAARRAPLDEA